jgi:hypothetical protein
MKWFSLDWLGLILNVFVLAIIPGALAAYGGHLAAEAIGEPKRSRNVKYCFWGLFAFGVLATFWQQFRASESDLDRNTNETWAQTLATSKFLPPPPPANIERRKTQIVPRSYVAIEDQFHFPEKKDKNGHAIQDQRFQDGDDLFFNVYFKCLGPTPIELVRNDSWLYVESAVDAKTQQSVIAEFKKNLRKSEPAQSPAELSTIMPGQGGFFTAYASTDSGGYRKLSNDDLEQFRTGAKVSFAFAQVTYKDKGIVHHARRCSWLQPPADPPGVWHFCDGFNKSD